MKNFIAIASLAVLCATAAFAQTSRGVLVNGQPPLTQEMVDHLAFVYETILEFKLTPAQRERFRQGEIAYWTENNPEGKKLSLSNLQYYGKDDEMQSLHNESTQNTIIEALRRDILASNDPVSVVIVEAFDNAHHGRAAATSVKTFKDLVGGWRRSDSLLADRQSYGSEQIGVSYTDSGSLEIRADGSFKLVKVHNHIQNGCSRLDGSTESGLVSLEGSSLFFQVTGGSEQVEDGCLKRQSHTVLKPRGDKFSWSIRSNPNNESATMLCLSTPAGKSECYEKQ
jgi:hypothetical protein